jgi:hypothetical protein
MNQSWYDHLTPGKVKYGNLYYLLIHYCERINDGYNERYNDFICIRYLRRFIRYKGLDTRLKSLLR